MPRARLRTSRGSPIAAPTVMRGLSEVTGSWNTIWARARMARRVLASAPASSVPRTRTLPLVGGMRPTLALETVDLPQPLSPTRPRVSPDAIDSDTPSTARMGAPPRPAKWTLRSVISSVSAHAIASAWWQAVRRAGAIGRSFGVSLVQRASARGQRLAKRQPGPYSAGVGTRPSMVASGDFGVSDRRGMEASSSAV